MRGLARYIWLPGLALLIALFFHRMAFSALILARGDTFLYFYPYWEAAANALRDGRVPLWNPHLFMGAPLLANSQMGFFYPLNWPLWLTLPTPYAVSATILLHLWIAGWGAYLAGRRALNLSPQAAFLAAALFALGGYLTAQAEHVNQLQGLAWLPWFFVIMGRRWTQMDADFFSNLRLSALICVLFALQLLAGHTQTAFISGVGVGLWLLAAGSLRPTAVISRLLPLAGGAVLAVGIAAAQLLPTLELARLSSRQGGLSVNEALSFSLNPLLAGQALLPAYGRALFSEYVAFLPLTGLFLATLAVWQWRSRPELRPLILLTAVGLFFALGQFNPVYWTLAHLPGFGHFRAPARWLILYALGGALLAGVGWDSWRRPTLTGFKELSGFLPVALLLIWAVAAVPLGRFFPVAPESPLNWPHGLTLLGWTAELVIFLFLARRPQPGAKLSLIPLALLALFLSSRSLPYHNLTTPEAYFDQRPPGLRLQAAAFCPDEMACPPPDRFLSLSHTFFDPGDQAEIDAIYAGVLPLAAQYDYTIAIKQKEIIAPNFPMVYGLASIDGYDGGILPLFSYSELVSATILDGQATSDGRLREYLTAVPDNDWLSLMNVRYLITDKVGDRWHDGVFFDLQHAVTVTPEQGTAVSYLPPFEATEIRFAADGRPGGLVVQAGGRAWRLAAEPLAEADIWRATLPEPLIVASVTLTADTTPWTLRGISLLDGRDLAFQPLTVGPYRLIHSGDVKIYENLRVLPRAFIVDTWTWQPNRAAALAAITAPAFDPLTTAVLTGDGEPAATSFVVRPLSFVHYNPERIELAANGASGLLILTDAHYPGWVAEIDGRETPIYEANGFFRAIFLPKGAERVVFSYQPRSYQIGVWATAVSLLLWLVLLLGTFRWRRGNG